MTTLYIDRNNLELRLEGRALTCYEDGQRVGTIPTAPLERVVMRGTAKVETQAIAKLGSLDRVIFSSAAGMSRYSFCRGRITMP